MIVEAFTDVAFLRAVCLTCVAISLVIANLYGRITDQTGMEMEYGFPYAYMTSSTPPVHVGRWPLVFFNAPKGDYYKVLPSGKIIPGNAVLDWSPVMFLPNVLVAAMVLAGYVRPPVHFRFTLISAGAAFVTFGFACVFFGAHPNRWLEFAAAFAYKIVWYGFFRFWVSVGNSVVQRFRNGS